MTPLAGALFTAFLVLGGCTGGGRDDRTRGEAPGEIATSGPGAGEGFVRGCEERVYGDLGNGWRDRRLEVGPVAFVGATAYEHLSRARFGAPGGRGYTAKVLADVERGHTVVISIPESARSYGTLLYDPSKFTARRFGGGDESVLLKACSKGAAPGEPGGTQFNGGVIVDGPGCLPVDVAADGSTEPLRTFFGFGTRDCH